MTVPFLRTKTVTVRPLDAGALQVEWMVKDDLLDAEVQLKVQPPDLEIVEASATIPRHLHPGYANAAEAIERVVGVRIGPGLRKIVTGLMVAERGADELVEAVLEACNAVILHFTLPQIRAGEGMTRDELREANRRLLEYNPRMLGSCVAWQPGSPLLKELEVES
jgi:hypothetical protein